MVFELRQQGIVRIDEKRLLMRGPRPDMTIETLVSVDVYGKGGTNKNAVAW